MRSGVLLDTGPLVALLDRRDEYHAWACTMFSEIEPPLLTCEAVVTEGCHLARRNGGRSETVLGLIERGVVRVAFRLNEELAAVTALLEGYSDVPMPLADACLVRMSERAGAGAGTVFTLDSDFRVYRRGRRRKIPVLMPPGR